MRRKALRPVDLPLGVVAIDGKSVWTGDEKVNDFCQRSHKEGGMPYWHFRVLRAALVSAAAPVCIDQAPIPAETNDMGAFPDFFSALRREYSRSQLFEVVTMDAGFCSEQNARLVDEAGYGYVMGLKGNQPELLAEAQRILMPLADETPPHAVSSWEREGGRAVQRRFWRTREMAAWQDWSHLRRSGWSARSLVARRAKRRWSKTVSLSPICPWAGWIPPSASPWSGGTGASRTTATTRSHTHWREDTGFWPRKGNGLLVCSLLRMIAYNILWLLRVVHLRSRDARAIPWRQLRDLVRDALVLMRTRAHRQVLNLV